MAVYLYEKPYDPWQELARHHESLGARRTQCGASAVFVGSMRDFNQGLGVSTLWLEHYPAMTQRYLLELEAEAQAQWDLLDTLIIHRYGQVHPAEAIVVVAAWSAHRQPALAACHHLVEALKAKAPFWKQEQTESGPRWVIPDGHD